MPSNHIEDCVPELRDAWPKLKANFEEEFPGWAINLDCTHRSPEEQFVLFKLGRFLNSKTKEWEVVEPAKVVTYRDGFEKASNHNCYPAKAFDVKIQDPNKDYTWNATIPQWQYMLDLAKRHKLVSGGSWEHFKDWPHFEVKAKKA